MTANIKRERKLTYQLLRKGLPSRIARIDLVPVLHFGLAKPPAEQHMPTGHLAGKVDESEARILELNSEVFELSLVTVDLSRKRLHRTLESSGALTRLIRASAGRHQVELQNRLAPATVLLDDIVDDFADEGKRAVCLLDGEQLHERKILSGSG